MPKSIDRQIQDVKKRIKLYENKLSDLEDKKLEMLMNKKIITKKEARKLIKNDITLRDIIEGEKENNDSIF